MREERDPIGPGERSELGVVHQYAPMSADRCHRLCGTACEIRIVARVEEGLFEGRAMGIESERDGERRETEVVLEDPRDRRGRCAIVEHMVEARDRSEAGLRDGDELWFV